MSISPEEIKTLQKQVGTIPWWIRKIPGFQKISGIPLKNRFLLNPALYEDFLSEKPSHLVIGIVIHEIEHIKRAKEKGFFKYHILYRLSSKFRYEEELACHKPQFTYHKAAGYSFDLKQRAKLLSGSLYLWPVSYEKALRDLENIWEM